MHTFELSWVSRRALKIFHHSWTYSWTYSWTCSRNYYHDQERCSPSSHGMGESGVDLTSDSVCGGECISVGWLGWWLAERLFVNVHRLCSSFPWRGIIRFKQVLERSCIPVNRWPNFELFQNMPASMCSLCSCDCCKTDLNFQKESGFVEHRFLKLQVLHDGPFQAQVLLACLACFWGILVISPCSVNVLGMQIWMERPFWGFCTSPLLWFCWHVEPPTQCFGCIFQCNSGHIGESCIALELEPLPRPLDVAVPHWVSQIAWYEMRFLITGPTSQQKCNAVWPNCAHRSPKPRHHRDSGVTPNPMENDGKLSITIWLQYCKQRQQFIRDRALSKFAAPGCVSWSLVESYRAWPKVEESFFTCSAHLIKLNGTLKPSLPTRLPDTAVCHKSLWSLWNVLTEILMGRPDLTSESLCPNNVLICFVDVGIRAKIITERLELISHF